MTKDTPTQLHKASGEFAPKGDLMRLGIKVAGLGLGAVDYLTDTITLDETAATYFDLPSGIPLARDLIHDKIWAEDRGGVEEAVALMLRHDGSGVMDLIHRVGRSADTVRWLRARKEVTFGPDPAGGPHPVPHSGLVAVMDITDLKQAEGRIAGLMGEMNHRIKNLMTVIQSIVRMTARTGAPETLPERLIKRLSALGQNQDLLMGQGLTDVTLHQLISKQLSAFVGTNQDRLILDGQKIPLLSTAVQPLGLALHELATNATKYGALSHQDGAVNVSWTVVDDTFHFSWAEVGGPVVVAPTTKGFGSSVLGVMVTQSLNGDVTLDYAPMGLKWDLSCPVSEILSPKAARPE